MFSNGIAAFTFDTVHTAIPLEILAIKRIYELFYAIELYCRIMLTQIILPTRILSTVEGRFEFVFTPKHASWLNLVESFFSKMTRQMLKGIRVKSKEELIHRIYTYFDEISMGLAE